jgi:arylsulfatase A-like enzyme
MKKPPLILLVLLVLGAWFSGPAHCSAANRPPNIIFILADDLGWGDLGCYGQKKIRTPNLDRLAAEGMRFTSAYAGSTVCAPSRCALLTGLHTGHCRIRGNSAEQYPLRPEDRTVTELLKEAGYRTACLGKWGLGAEGSTGLPRSKGFDEFFGYLTHKHAHDYYPEFLWRNEDQFRMPKNQGGAKGDYATDWFSRAARNFVRDSAGGPFFLYLAYTTPHANNERQRAEGLGMEVPSDEPYTGENWPQPEKNKAAMITRMDADIGALLTRLKELKLDEQTVVFFASDNGPHKEGGNDPEFFDSNGPWRGIKRDLTEGGIRVPFLARWPGKIAPGSVSDLPIALWDFPATAAELAGLPAPARTDGISFAPTLLGRPGQRRHEYLYWELHERGFQQALRFGEWKAIQPAGGKPIELYHLATDPGENVNVAAANPLLVAQAREWFRTARTESERWPVSASAAPAAGRKKTGKQ